MQPFLNPLDVFIMNYFKPLLAALVLASAWLLPTSAQIPAQLWNNQVVGWNLGNQFECSAPGQDGESQAIGNLMEQTRLKPLGETPL